MDRGDGAKGKGLDGPHYRVTDQEWNMCKSRWALISLPQHHPARQTLLV